MDFSKSNRKKYLLVAACLLIVSVLIYRFWPKTILNVGIANVNNNGHVIRFDMYKEAASGYLYKSRLTGAAAALDFIRHDPQYQTFGMDAKTKVNLPIFPRNIARQLKLINADNRKDNAAYTYQQSLNGTPVYKATVTVHVRNGHEIYATEGKLVPHQVNFNVY